MEQAVGATALWCADVTKFAQGEMDKVSAGTYRFNDLVAAPIRLTQIWFKHAIDATFTFSDNISLISSARSGAPAPPRTVSVPVRIPANAEVQLVPSELKGRSGHRIPPKCVHVGPIEKSAEARYVDVLVTVSSPHAPNDLYEGFLRCADPVIEVPFAVTIHELGVPLS